MGPLMLSQVDQFRRFARSANRRFLYRFPLADQRDYAPVMIGIHFAVEQKDSGHLHGLNDRINFGGITAFRKIRDTFNQSTGHGEKDNGQQFSQATTEKLPAEEENRLWQDCP
jgi:hypothetical protein